MKGHDPDLSRPTIVVTGAAGGIGSAVVRRLAADGYGVYAVDRDATGLEELMGTVSDGPHAFHAVDFSDRGAMNGWLGDLAKSRLNLTGLVHLAAELRRSADLFSISEEDWDAQVDTNLRATFFVNRAVAKQLIAAGRPGSLVNFASQGWWTGGLSGSLVYAASKGGVVTLTRGLARALAPHGIRVNVVAPGFVDTPMMRSGMTEQALEDAAALVPLGRMAVPEEIADIAAFLISSDSRYMTGATLNASGGQLMY